MTATQSIIAAAYTYARAARTGRTVEERDRAVVGLGDALDALSELASMGDDTADDFLAVECPDLYRDAVEAIPGYVQGPTAGIEWTESEAA